VHLLLGALAGFEVKPGLLLLLGNHVHLLESFFALVALLKLLFLRLGLVIVRRLYLKPLQRIQQPQSTQPSNDQTPPRFATYSVKMAGQRLLEGAAAEPISIKLVIPMFRARIYRLMSQLCCCGAFPEKSAIFSAAHLKTMEQAEVLVRCSRAHKGTSDLIGLPQLQHMQSLNRPHKAALNATLSFQPSELFQKGTSTTRYGSRGSPWASRLSLALRSLWGATAPPLLCMSPPLPAAASRCFGPPASI
jgi:hypothetical protein